MRVVLSLKLGLVALVISALAACTAVATEPSQTPRGPQETAPAQQEPTDPEPEPHEVPFMIPECTQLITAEELSSLFSPKTEPVVDPYATNLAKIHRLQLGPAARQAQSAATQYRPCAWGLPSSDSVTYLFVAELPDQVRDRLLAELRDSDYEESASGDIAMFSHTSSGGRPVTNLYGFKGNAWVATEGSGGISLVEFIFKKLDHAAASS